MPVHLRKTCSAEVITIPTCVPHLVWLASGFKKCVLVVPKDMFFHDLRRHGVSWWFETLATWQSARFNLHLSGLNSYLRHPHFRLQWFIRCSRCCHVTPSMAPSGRIRRIPICTWNASQILCHQWYSGHYNERSCNSSCWNVVWATIFSIVLPF